MAPACLSEIGAFGTASGLRMNIKKMVTIRLAPGATPDVADASEVPVPTCDANCRYLGTQAGP